MKKIGKLKAVLLVTVLVIATFTCTACKKEASTDDTGVVGNTAGIADSETNYSDTQGDTAQPIQSDGGEAEISYIDQKAEGDPQPVPENGTEQASEPEGYAPIEYHNAQEIPEGSYCIAHTNDDGSVTYYPIYPAYGSYYMVEAAAGAAVAQPERFMWTRIGYDDSAIPTMHQGDTLVFKSADAIPEAFTFERYSDEGYTIGVAGLVKANSGNYLYDLEKSYVNETSDTVGLKTLGASQVYIVSAGNVRVSPSTVSATGTIKGLKRNENYYCDVRTGTESITAAFRADSHLFVSLEQYKLASFYFSAKHTIEIGMESTMPTGYYSVNNAGLFRYVASKDEGKTLSASDYNVPFITTNAEGKLVSTIDGYAIDDDGFIVKER